MSWQSALGTKRFELLFAASDPAHLDFLRGYVDAIATLDHLAQTSARDLLIEELEARLREGHTPFTRDAK